MIAARPFLKSCRLKHIDGFSGWPIASAVWNNSKRPEHVARRFRRTSRYQQAAEDVIDRRSFAPHPARQAGSIEDPMDVQIIDVTNRPTLKGVAPCKCSDSYILSCH